MFRENQVIITSDIYSRQKRSIVMSKIKAKGNKSTEFKFIKLLRSSGITGWRCSYPVKGHPDFVFLKERVAIFIDGCFWHNHDCRNTISKNNAEFWRKKREYNFKHDKETTALFENRGWTVLRIWECELKNSKQEETVCRIIATLQR